MTRTFQINVGNTICKFKFAIAREAIEYQCKVLVTLYIAGAFEEFVQNCTNDNP